MSLRSTLRRLSTRLNVALLLAVAALSCGWAWRGATSPAQGHINMGLQKLQEGQGLAAAIEWREAVRLDPGNAHVWELLGDYHQSAEDWSSALDAFGHLQKLSPDAPNLHARMATCALAANDIGAARSQAEAALKQDADDVAALRVAASVSGTQNRHDEHLKYLRHLADLLPRDPAVLYALAVELSKRYDYAGARPLLDRALQIEPGSAEVLSARAAALLSEPTPENLEGARADWEKVLAMQPSDAEGNIEVHRSLARVAMLQGRTREAIAHFEAVGRGRPYASAHFAELARAYREAGEPRKAEALQRRFLALKAQNVAMQDLKDRIERSPRELKSYLQMVALQVAGVEAGGDGYELYRFRYAQKQIGPAQFYMAQARRLAPRDPQVLALSLRLESAYARRLQAALRALDGGDLKTARAQLDRAQSLRPDDPRTRDALSKLLLRQRSGP